MQELIRLAVRAIVGHRLRSALSMVGIAIGIASVILLTSIGEGTRVYLISQFTQFGTNLVAINPGKAETMGMPGALGGTTHKLTIDDSEALTRILGVDEVVPVTFGMARVEAGGRGRSVIVYGATAEAPEVWKWDVQVGAFWPPGDPRRGPAQAVLGAKLKRELFGNDSALGEFVKIAGARYRVVGLMEPKGMFLGFDLDDSAWIPVSEAMRIFNLEELQEIDLTINNSQVLDEVIERIRVTLTERHDGKEDFTVTSQAAMLEVFDNIMNIITMGVGAIAGISLLVGAIGILTMMWIAVGERTQEIGLIRSIGATREQVQLVFLTEAAFLSTLGGLLGVAVGLGLCALLRTAIPGLPVQTPVVYVVAAVAVSLAMGLASGVSPARRAAGLDPIEALRAE
ncbi:MAG: ABC transporter permease [Thermoanaerobaculia bacterium]